VDCTHNSVVDTLHLQAISALEEIERANVQRLVSISIVSVKITNTLFITRLMLLSFFRA
jgi:hypothetical protein